MKQSSFLMESKGLGVHWCFSLLYCHFSLLDFQFSKCWIFLCFLTHRLWCSFWRRFSLLNCQLLTKIKWYFTFFWEKLKGEDGPLTIELFSLIIEDWSGIIMLELSSVTSNGGSFINFLLVAFNKVFLSDSSLGAGRTF